MQGRHRGTTQIPLKTVLERGLYKCDASFLVPKPKSCWREICVRRGASRGAYFWAGNGTLEIKTNFLNTGGEYKLAD